MIKYDKWHYICGNLNKTEVCGVLNCTNTAQKPVDEKLIARDKNVFIRCPPKYYSFSQCVESAQAINCEPAEIKCQGTEIQSSLTQKNICLFCHYLLFALG